MPNTNNNPPLAADKPAEDKPPAVEQFHPLRLVFGGVLVVLLAIATLFILFSSNIAPHQYEILRMLMAAFTAVLFPIFGGQISVKTSLFGAVGGVAVWALFPFLFGAMASKTTVTVFLQSDSRPLTESVSVEIRYADESDSKLSSTSGEVLFRVPSGLSQIDTIFIDDGKTYRPRDAGPYSVGPGKALTLDLIQEPTDGPGREPKHPNETVDIPAIPAKEDVLEHSAGTKPEDVRLTLHNKTDRDLTLWLFDCWKYHSQIPRPWKELPFPRTQSPTIYEEFHSKKDGNGIYCVLVEYEPEKYKYLDVKDLFKTPTTSLIVTGEGHNIVLEK
jgi:hypothetical protein